MRKFANLIEKLAFIANVIELLPAPAAAVPTPTYLATGWGRCRAGDSGKTGFSAYESRESNSFDILGT